MTAPVQPSITADVVVFAYGQPEQWPVIPRVGVPLSDAEVLADHVRYGTSGDGTSTVVMVSPAHGGFQLSTWHV